MEGNDEGGAKRTILGDLDRGSVDFLLGLEVEEVDIPV